MIAGPFGWKCAIVLGVSAARDPESKAKTLGDLIYADKTKVRVTEDEWLNRVRSIAAGDQLALHSLYEQTYTLVFTLILRIVGNRETAEELALDVYHDVWRRASAYDPAGGSVIGWIMNQARSRAIDQVRFQERKKRVKVHADDPLARPADRDPQQSCQFEEQSQMLRSALDMLTVEERKVIETTFWGEMTYQQTAEQLNQPLGTVKTRIRSGLKKLRQALASGLMAI
jgi:RNA polymerase sigma-70 factor, ECF subfamily